ncbi:MAG: metal ABC transporter permease [Treponema sp.]
MSTALEAVRSSLAALAVQGSIPHVFSYAFFVNSLLASLIISPVLGGIGTMIVIKRMAFFSNAIGNAALTGIAAGILLGEPFTAPYISLFSFCILFGIIMNYTKNNTKMNSDTITGVFLSISLGCGSALLLFVVTKVNAHILDGILFGSILTIDDLDLLILLITAVICCSIGIPLFNKMLAASFNPALAQVRGINVILLDYLFVIVITLITVASVKIIGAILVEALLLIPASSARNIAKSLESFFMYSVLFSVASCTAGVLIPILFEIPVPSGSAVILVASGIFIITTSIRILSAHCKGTKI